MKVATLAPAPPPGASWRVVFKARDTANVLQSLYVEMDAQTGTPTFNYGWGGGATYYDQCGALNGPATCPVTGSYLPDGTIVMKLDTSTPLNGVNAIGDPLFTVNFPVGAALTDLQGRTETSGAVIDTTGTSTVHRGWQPCLQRSSPRGSPDGRTTLGPGAFSRQL